MPKSKVCKICQKTIKTNSENWNQLKCYTKKKLVGTHYFHDSCYLNFIRGNIQNTMSQGVAQLLQRANIFMDKMGADKLVEIK